MRKGTSSGSLLAIFQVLERLRILPKGFPKGTLVPQTVFRQDLETARLILLKRSEYSIKALGKDCSRNGRIECRIFNMIGFGGSATIF